MLAVNLDVSAQTFNGQPYDLKIFNKEKENVLNMILNSTQFDSIYNSKRVVFIENELLTKTSLLKLKKGKCKVKIKRKNEIKPNEEYVALGDFTCDPSKMTHVRVQISNSIKHVMLNISTDKLDNGWKISNHIIMQD